MLPSSFKGRRGRECVASREKRCCSFLFYFLLDALSSRFSFFCAIRIPDLCARTSTSPTLLDFVYISFKAIFFNCSRVMMMMTNTIQHVIDPARRNHSELLWYLLEGVQCLLYVLHVHGSIRKRRGWLLCYGTVSQSSKPSV